MNSCKNWPFYSSLYTSMVWNPIILNATFSLLLMHLHCFSSSHEGEAITVTVFNSDTVDGRSPASLDMVNIPLFIGFHTSQVVQQYPCICLFGCLLMKFLTTSSVISAFFSFACA